MSQVNATERPDTRAVFDQLKDFQQQTVEYIFRRMYLDDDCTRRFLLADEVGLGKTLVARGVIAKTIEHLWDQERRIDVIYVCSNADIARQNINRLNITGHDDFSLASRITLLPINVSDMQNRRINFVSFTPGTSFELKDSAGMSRERELLYWLLKEPWNVSFKKGTCLLSAYAGIDGFRRRVEQFPSRFAINTGIQRDFAEQLAQRPELQQEFNELCEAMPRAGSNVPKDLNRQRIQFIGELRRLLAETCLHWLEPDLIILDEFQRFKYLLGGNDEQSSEAAQLAEHLFTFQEHQDNPDSAARVLLLSATPYKMYTLNHESAEDDHYEDFLLTLRFLMADDERLGHFKHTLSKYRDELLLIGTHSHEELLRVKRALEEELRRIMVRTERLALSDDRNGMLRDASCESVALKAGEIEDYLNVQRVARGLGQSDVMEYWKSSPYLLNFMDNYQIKKKLRTAMDQPRHDRKLIRAIREANKGLLSREELERYQEIDPANYRLRLLSEDTIARGAWQLLWMPPSLPYYQAEGAFSDPHLSSFTKRLVFSSWNVVPKTIASILSYQAEREMIRSFRFRAHNTAEARKKRRALLKFSISRGRLTGMPVLALLYPCHKLAEQCDPLHWRGENDSLSTTSEVLAFAATKIRPLLEPIIANHASDSEPVDERWYWAAGLLIDGADNPKATGEWFERKDLAKLWAGELNSMDKDAARGFSEHLELAREVLAGKVALGQPPEDLADVLSLISLASPGVTSLRALRRICPELPANGEFDARNVAAPLAYAFLHLFNIPEVMYLLRERRRETPYWQRVLEYCLSGNLQSVLDEYAHILVESQGLLDKPPYITAQKVSQVIQASVSLRTSTAQADIISASNRRIHLEDPIRLRTRFAMRFGDQDTEGSGEATRADAVRSAFNSPFWPFVLATTSIGQEGLDFHPYCHAVVHWNLPSNPVDLEQREGRVHRYKGHAVRKNIATEYHHAARNDHHDPWDAMFQMAKLSRPVTHNDLFPFWITPNGHAKIERHVPALPHSREAEQQANLRRSLVIYRMVFGQSRQEDLVRYMLSQFTAEEAAEMAELCRIDLSPQPLLAAPPS